MKKVLVSVLALAVVLGSACSLNSGASATDASDSVTESTKIEFDYPDQLKFSEGGTLQMTIYRCGAVYYACVDGEKGWKQLYGEPPLELGDCEFVHLEADFDRVYGGVKGYWGNMLIQEVRDEKYLTLDEVAEYRILELFDLDEGLFSGARLIVKDGKNYLICRDPMLQYRVYDNNNNLLCTYDSVMAAAAFLDDAVDQTIEYSSRKNLTCYIIRIGNVYYSYSRYDGMNTWVPLLNLHFENKPVGFELEDGQAMYVASGYLYKVNGGQAGYVNVPMFEGMENTERALYSTLNDSASTDHWEAVSQYENGKMYQYYYGLDEYMIFYLEDEFYVYHEYSSDMESEEFTGRFSTADEVNKAIGR